MARQYVLTTRRAKRQSQWRQILSEADLTDHHDVEKIIGTLAAFYESLTSARVELNPLAKVINKVVAAERWIHQKQTDVSQTDYSFRNQQFRDGFQRMRLHAEIVERLLTRPRPKDDEEISMESGGACPPEKVSANRSAYILTGPPSSGKSSLARAIFFSERALMVDPDDAKRMLPEYEKGANAHMLHAESSHIVKGRNGLFECAVARGYNFVMPTVGADAAGLERTAETLQWRGYEVFLLTVDCPAEVAAYRALKRTLATGRYVPLRYILSEVHDQPRLAFSRASKWKGWTGYAEYDTWSARTPILKRCGGSFPKLEFAGNEHA